LDRRKTGHVTHLLGHIPVSIQRARPRTFQQKTFRSAFCTSQEQQGSSAVANEQPATQRISQHFGRSPAGNTIEKFAPELGVEETITSPPCSSTISLAIESPSPVPDSLVVMKCLKMFYSVRSPGRPGPVSRTNILTIGAPKSGAIRSAAPSSRYCHPISILSPLFHASRAFWTRLDRARLRACSSPSR